MARVIESAEPEKMTLEEIEEAIELALSVARKNFHNDQPTIDNIQDELWDAFDLWDEDSEEGEEDA